MASCRRCNKKIGLFSQKHKVGSHVFCPACYVDYLEEAEKKKEEERRQKEVKRSDDKKIIKKYAQKYITKLTPQETVHISDINKWSYLLITEEYPEETELEVGEEHNLTKKPQESLISVLINERGNFRSLNALSAGISFELNQYQIFSDNIELHEESYELGLERVPLQKNNMHSFIKPM